MYVVVVHIVGNV